MEISKRQYKKEMINLITEQITEILEDNKINYVHMILPHKTNMNRKRLSKYLRIVNSKKEIRISDHYVNLKNYDVINININDKYTFDRVENIVGLINKKIF